MSQPHTRKTFFRRLTALFAVSALTPKLFGRAATPAAARPSGGAAFRIQPDTRAIARDAGSL